MTDPEFLTEWAQQVVLHEQDRVLAEELANILGQVDGLITRAEEITELRQGPLGVESTTMLRRLYHELERLAAQWRASDG